MATNITDGAADLGMSSKQLRRWIRKGAPVIRTGGKGRGRSTLIDPCAVRAWLSTATTETEAKDREFCDGLIASAADGAVELFKCQSGPHKAALAANLLLQWALTANLLRARFGLPPITPAEYPETMKKMDRLVGNLSRFDTLESSK